MSVEFQLGHQDHPSVEDFLARGHEGVGAISLHPKSANHQQAAAEAARDSGLHVLFDPRTERLTHPGRTHDGLPAYTGDVYDLNALAANPAARQQIVDLVWAAHPNTCAIATAPYFLISDRRTAYLNLALAETMKLSTDLPVRPVVLVHSRFVLSELDELAKEYAAAGFAEVDLRFTPFGGENESLRKIRQVFAATDAFRAAGLRVVLGRSGNIGQAAFALGHADAYSVGLGEMEHVDHAADLSRQNKPPKLDKDGHKLGGHWEGVYLPGPAITLSKKRATELLGHSDVRTRLGCRIGACADTLMGPVADHKGHYLHARAAEMVELIAIPPAWRPKAETDRLRRAIEVRDLVNRHYRGDDDPPLKTRTLHSLVDGIEGERSSAVA